MAQAGAAARMRAGARPPAFGVRKEPEAKVFWFFFSKKNRFLPFHRAHVLIHAAILVAIAQAPAMAEGAAVLSCGGAADGRLYVALGAEVFAFPNMAPLAMLAAPRPVFFEIPSGKPMYASVEKGAEPIAPPDLAMAEGCRGNPAQRQSIDVDPAVTLGVALADPSDVKQAGQVTLAVRRFPEIYGGSRTSLGPMFISEDDALAQRRAEMQRRYVKTQAAFCASQAGQGLMHNAAFACFYRPMGEPQHGWIGSYLPPKRNIGPDFAKLSFTCAANQAEPRLTSCTVSYMLKPELDLRFSWIDIRYEITLDAPTRAELIDQVTEYDRAIRAGFDTVTVMDYPWPPPSLAAWRAAQPSDESLRRAGTEITGTAAKH